MLACSFKCSCTFYTNKRTACKTEKKKNAIGKLQSSCDRFKPVDLKFIMRPFKEEFEEVFCETFSRNQNAVFLGHVQTCFTQKRWRDLLAVVDHVCSTAVRKNTSTGEFKIFCNQAEVAEEKMGLLLQYIFLNFS